MPEKPLDPPMRELFRAIYRDAKDDYAGQIMEYRHIELEFDLFTRANSSLTMNGKIYKITNGTLLLVVSRDMHRFVHDPDSAYNRFVVMFSEQFVRPALSCMNMDGFLDELKNWPRVLQLNPALQRHMQSDFSLLVTCCSRWEKNHDVNLRAILVTTLIHLLMEMSIEQNKKPVAQPKSQQKQQVQKIMSYIDLNYIDDLTLEKISEVSFLSKYYITRIFKRETGYSVLEYIHHKRVAQAQNMLVETDLEIVDIAMHCGFNNLSNFYHVFNNAVGMPPMYYRKHYGKHPVLN